MSTCFPPFKMCLPLLLCHKCFFYGFKSLFLSESVLIFHCYTTNYPKWSHSKQHKVIISVSVDQEFSTFGRVLGLGSHNAEIAMLASFIVIRKLDWEKTHFQVASGCWQHSSFCNYKSEVPTVLLAVDQSQVLAMWPPPNQQWGISLALNSSCVSNLSDFPFCNQHTTPPPKKANSAFKGLMCSGRAHLDNFPILKSTVPYNIPSYRSKISYAQSQRSGRARIPGGWKSWGPS